MHIGAEAVVTISKNVTKDRVKKSYRIDEIDSSMRQARTKREAKILDKLGRIGYPSPRLIEADSSIIVMEYIHGRKVRDILESDFLNIGMKIGLGISLLHDNDIMHGDLTTSNMIHSDDRLYLIDFGLSKFSSKVEDKAVDLHLLRQALESKHNTIWEKCFKIIIQNYRPKNRKEVLARLEKIEQRGRNKAK